MSFYEYTYIDSSKKILNAVHIKGIDTPPCKSDAGYYQFVKKVNITQFPVFWYAKLYNAVPGKQYHAMYGGLHYENETMYEVAAFFSKKKHERRKKAKKKESKEDKKDFGYYFYVPPLIETDGEYEKDFYIKDTLYKGENCYYIVSESTSYRHYNEKQYKEFEKSIKDKSIEEQDSLRYIVKLNNYNEDYQRKEYIVNKTDYALLKSQRYKSIKLNTGKEIPCNITIDEYEKCTDGKYRQILYKNLYKRDLTKAYSHIDDRTDEYTYVVKKPLNEKVPEQYQSVATLSNGDGYISFCERVDTLTEEMLKEWQY